MVSGGIRQSEAPTAVVADMQCIICMPGTVNSRRVLFMACAREEVVLHLAFQNTDTAGKDLPFEEHGKIDWRHIHTQNASSPQDGKLLCRLASHEVQQARPSVCGFLTIQEAGRTPDPVRYWTVDS